MHEKMSGFELVLRYDECLITDKVKTCNYLEYILVIYQSWFQLFFTIHLSENKFRT